MERYFTLRFRMTTRLPTLLWLLMLATPLLARDDRPAAVHPEAFANLHIPKIESGPVLADFLNMQPSPAFTGKMLKVEGFVQRDPKDGAPVSQKTEVYLGYTDRNLYVVCVCFDSEPSKIRARRARRDRVHCYAATGVA